MPQWALAGGRRAGRCPRRCYRRLHRRRAMPRWWPWGDERQDDSVQAGYREWVWPRWSAGRRKAHVCAARVEIDEGFKPWSPVTDGTGDVPCRPCLSPRLDYTTPVQGLQVGCGQAGPDSQDEGEVGCTEWLGTRQPISRWEGEAKTAGTDTSDQLTMNWIGVASNSEIGESQCHLRTHFCCPAHATLKRTMRDRVNPLLLVNPRGCERPNLPG